MRLDDEGTEEPIRLNGIFYDNWRATTTELSNLKHAFRDINVIVFCSTRDQNYTDYIVEELGFSLYRITGFLEKLVDQGQLNLEGKSREYIEGVNLAIASGIRIH